MNRLTLADGVSRCGVATASRKSASLTVLGKWSLPFLIAALIFTMVFPTTVYTQLEPVSFHKPGEEMVKLRTETSKTYYLGENERGLEISVGAIHYKNNYADPQEQWKDIDLTWEGNRITKAPYELVLDGNKATLRDKRTDEVSTIELLDIKPAGLEWMIIPEFSSVRFQHILSSDKIPFEARFKVTGSIPFLTRAYDDKGELVLETSLIDGILTEKLSKVRDKETRLTRVAVGSIRVDPTWQIGASSDDCARRLVPNYWSLTFIVVNAGRDGVSYYGHGGGMRFTSITIPQGTTVSTSYLNLIAYSTLSGTAAMTRVSAEDVDDAPTFANDSDAFDARWANRTTARVDWDYIPDWTAEVEYNSPEIKTVIQEIVDRVGWASGNDIVIFWDDFEQRSPAVEGRNMRDAYSYDSSSTKAPKLYIEYSLSPTVVTQAATNITSSSATQHGNVTEIGDTSVTERGFDWDTDTGVPYSYNWTETGTFSTGTFSHEITDQEQHTAIYFRAKALNDSSPTWGYGSEETFTTLWAPPDAPADFTITSLGGSMVAINWTKAVDANADTTLIVGKSGSYPRNKTDGWVAYNGTASYTTDSHGISFNLESPFYKAWSYNLTVGFSTLYAQATLGGGSMLLLGFLGLACFFTWFSHKRRDILISTVAFLLWFGTGMWLFFSGDAPFNLTESYVQILAWVFVIMAFVPILMQMNTEIRHERKGRSWTEYGRKPEERSDTQEEYKRMIQNRWRRR